MLSGYSCVRSSSSLGLAICCSSSRAHFMNRWFACMVQYISTCAPDLKYYVHFFPGDRALSDKSIHDRDIEWLEKSDGK